VTGNAANAATNLIKGGATYTLTNGTANAGTDGTVAWTNFGKLNAGTAVNFQNTGSITGTVTAPTLNFSTYTAPISATVTGANAGTITGTGGFSGVSTINANGANSNTMGGTGQTYLLTNGTPDAGSSNSVNWTAFKNITDATGTVNFNNTGSLTGNLSAQTFNYTTYGQALTLNVTASSLLNSGVGGILTFNGTKTVNANAAQTNLVEGTNVIWTLTGANSGTGGGFNWSSFQNLTDTGSAAISGNGSVAGNIAVTGNAALSGSLAAGGNLSVGGNATVSGFLSSNGNLSVTGTTGMNGAQITSGGTQNYTGAVTASGTTNYVQSAASAITFGGSITGGTNFEIATGGTVTLGGPVSGMTNFYVTGLLPTAAEPNPFTDLTNIPKAGAIISSQSITSSSSTTGTITLSATNLAGLTGGTYTTGLLRLNAITPPPNNAVSVNVTNLAISGANTSWSLGGTVSSNKVLTPSGSDIGVTVGGTVLSQSALQSQAVNAASTASANAAAEAAKEAANTFGTDSVAEQIEYGFAGDVGNLPPMDHRLTGVGISVPKCFNESREGEDC